MKGKKKTQRELLLENAEDVIEMIENGKSYKVIAEKYKVRVENVFLFVNESEYSARARRALNIASYACLEQAERAIEEIKDDFTHAAVRRQVEKMNIALYKAKIKNRREFDLNYKEKEDSSTVKMPEITINLKKE